MSSVFDYGRKGDSWDTYWGSIGRKDLMGLDTNVLSSEQHDIVAAYMEAVGKDVDAGATLNSDNYGRDYWMNLYNEARSWVNDRSKEYSSGRAEYEKEYANERERKLAEYASKVESTYGNDHAAYNEVINKIKKEYGSAAASIYEQQAAAAKAQADAEAARAAAEKQAKTDAYKSAQSQIKTLAEQGLNLDNDNWTGESNQFNKYWSEIGKQLGAAGYDWSSMFSEDQQELLDYYAKGSKSYSDYQTLLGNIYSTEQDAFYNQYGTSANATQYAQSQRDVYQSQYDQYNQAVQSKLAEVAKIYEAYSSIGDISSAEGENVVEKVASAAGVQKGDFTEAHEYFTEDYTKNYQDLYVKLAKLYQTDDAAKTQELAEKYGGLLSEAHKDYNEQTSSYYKDYTDYANQLYKLYGDIDSVTSGLFSNYASNYSGKLASKANAFSSFLSGTQSDMTDLQSAYASAVSNLTSQRLSEKSSLQSQRASNQANKKRNKTLMGNSRTSAGYAVPSSYIDLTRGYSLLS